MPDDGGNAGISGLIDLPGQGAKFECWVRAHETQLTAAMINAAGRGDGEWPELRPGSSSGFLSVGAQVRIDGWPLPDRFRGERGTLTVTLNTGTTLAYAVRVAKETLKKSEKEANVWGLTLLCQIVDAPTAAGFGDDDQPASVVEALGDKEQWEGMSKTLDPQGLQSSAAARILTWGVGDNDAAEKAKVDDVLATLAAPYAGMKKRAGTFTRISKNAAFVTVGWGLTDTAEDVINEASATTVDPSHLQSAATTAAINAAPPTPSGGETWADRGTRTVELNDSHVLYVTTWGLTTTQQDVEYEGSEVRDDPADLNDETEIALVQTSATPSAPPTPAGLKLIAGPITKQLTPARWRHTWRYGRRDGKDAIEQEGTYVDADVSDLTSEGRQTTVFTTASGQPADPTPPSGLQIVGQRVTVRNNVKSVKVWYFAKDTGKQKEEQRRTFTVTDPSGLASRQAVALMDATPSVSAGFVSRGTRTEQVTHDHAINTVEGGLRTEADDRTFPKTKIETDRSALAQETFTAEPITTGAALVVPSAPTAGMVLADYFDVPETNAATTNKSIRVYRWSLVTNLERLTLPRYELNVDPQAIESRKRAGVVWDSAGAAPADPTGPSAHVLVGKQDVAVPTHPTKQVRVYTWGQRTSADDAAFPRTRTETDASSLSQDHQVAVVFTTGGSPSATSPPAGMVIAGFYDAPLTNAAASNLSVRVYQLSYVSNAQRLTLPRYDLFTDPNGLDTRKRSAVIWDATGLPPADPSTPAGLKIDAYRDVGLATTSKYQIRVYEWAKTDSVDRLVLPRTVLAADPSNIASRGTIAALNSIPATPAGYKSRFVRGFYQNGTDVVYEKEYGLNSVADDHVNADTVADSDAFEGVRLEQASLLNSSLSPYAIAANIFATYKADVTFEGVRVRKLNDSEALIVLRTRDDQIVVRYRFWGTGRQLVPAYFDGADVYVFLRQKVKIGTNLWHMELAEQYRNGARGEFTVERRVSGTSVNLFESAMNTSNGAAFLGLGIGKVAYTGLADGASNISVASPRVSRVVYGFEADSNGFIDMADASMGWQMTTTNLSSRAERTWHKATNLGLSAGVLSAADYSGFVT